MLDRETYLGIVPWESEEPTWLFDGETLTIRGKGEIGEPPGSDWFFRKDMPTRQEWRAFRKKVRYVVVEEGIRKIGRRYFLGCRNLESVTLPESLREIGDEAFTGCESLYDISLPRKLSRLGYSAFEGCEMLEEIEVPSGVRSLEEGVFQNCSSLRRVKLHEGLEELHDRVFADCCLEELQLPDSVRYIDRGALRYMKLDGADPEVEGLCVDGRLYFSSARHGGALFLSPKVRRIEPFALSGAVVSCIYIPNSVTEMRPRAMYFCRAENLYLGTGVTGLAEGFLMGCSSLENIFIAGKLESAEPGWDEDFQGRIFTLAENLDCLKASFREEEAGSGVRPRIRRYREPREVEYEFYRRNASVLRGICSAPAYPLTEVR